ncbi:MAG: HAD family hydrolase [Planctomycetes bacterium]|nr:HAD family hydrolase [Planctomycetota bacterium]
MRFEAVLFDLDGTLANTLRDIAVSANEALRRMGEPEHPLDAYRFFVGDGVAMLAERALPAEARSRAPEFAETFARVYRDHYLDTTRLYDGIAGLIETLRARGLRLAVLSNKPDAFVRATVTALAGDGVFWPVLGVREDVPRKPDPRGALRVAAELGVPPARILYLGDTATDMATAVAAGMEPAGVTWGFRPREELLAGGARHLVERPEEVLALLATAAPDGRAGPPPNTSHGQPSHG